MEMFRGSLQQVSALVLAVSLGTLAPTPVLAAGLDAYFSASVAPVPTPRPLYVVIAGFHSCRANVEGEVTAYSGKLWNGFSRGVLGPLLSSGVTPRVVAGCFSETLGVNPRLQFRLNATGSTETQVLDVGPLLTTPSAASMAPVIALVVNELNAQRAAEPGSVVHVVGHSYGAWVTMQTSLAALAQGTQLHALYTIDPISPLHCNVQAYLRAFFEIVPGCGQFPVDISRADRLRLRGEMTGGWRNFFQTQFHRLHSGPVPELDEEKHSYNIAVASPNALYNNQHAMIAEEPRIWNFIARGALREAALTSEAL